MPLEGCEPAEAPAPLTPETLARIEKLVRWRLSRWARHPDGEDMRQEALIRAWEAVERRSIEADLSTVVVNATDYARREFLRSQRATRPRTRPGAAREPFLVSWEALQAEALAEDRPELDQRRDLPHHPDFAAGLIELLERRAMVASLFARCTPAQRVVLWRRFWGGQTVRQMALELGLNRSAVDQRLAGALAKCRAHLAGCDPASRER